MKSLVKFFVVAILLVGATAESVFGQGMVYQTYQELSLAAGEGLSETWVQLPSNDYVRATHDGTNSVVETSGWTVNIQGGYWPCIAQYNGTIWCAVRQPSTSTVVVGSFTFPAGQGNVVLIKISSSGSVLNAWQASGSMSLFNIAVKDNSEIAVVGSGGTELEHLTSPNGGGVVLIHNGTDWDTAKGFFIERPSGGLKPLVYSAQYLSNGNLALSLYTEGGTTYFGGIPISARGLEDGLRGEITSTGVGISAVQIAGGGRDYHTLQITAPDGSFMVSGSYDQTITFYNNGGSVGGTLGQFPSGASHDHIYFAYYNASGVFQNAEVAYNDGMTTDMLNIDLVYGNNAFYAMIGNTNGGTVTTPTDIHSDAGPIVLKFDNSGIPIWSKQFQNVSGPVQFQYGEEILVSDDIVTLCGMEYIGCDLDFNSGVVSISSTSYWCEYFDGTVVGPTADFSGNPTSLEEGQSVTYTDQSIDGTTPITSWDWTFEGGTPGTYSGQTPPAITYNSAGTYDVTLVVSAGSQADTEVKVDYITVSAPPPSLTIDPNNITVSAASGNVNSMFTITSNESWSIVTSDQYVIATPSSGSGNQAIDVSYPAIYTMAGTTYTITITSNSGIVEIFTINQNGVVGTMVLNPSSAAVNADITSVSTVLSTQSDMSWTVDDSGLPTGWSVSPMSGTGDDTFVVTMPENTSVDPINGSFTVVGTGLGSGTTVTFPITQFGIDAPLVASASSDKAIYFIGETIQLYGGATGGTGSYSYEWTGTGGFTSSEQNPTFEPMDVGTYTFAVIVNDGENTVTDEVVVTVGEVIVLLESNTQTAQAGVPVHFTITVDFGDVNSATVDEIIFETNGDELSGFVTPWEFDYTYEDISGSPYDVEVTVFVSTGFIFNVSYPNYMDVITGQEEILSQDIKIYPNPTSGNIFIDAGKSLETVSIINRFGSEVIHMENLGENTQVDLSSLPNGLYFVRLMVDGILTTYKVVK